MQKIKNVLGRTKKAVVGSVVAAGAMVAGSANAALDTGVTTQFATTTADITEAGVLIIGLAVVAMGIRWVKATFF